MICDSVGRSRNNAVRGRTTAAHGGASRVRRVDHLLSGPARLGDDARVGRDRAQRAISYHGKEEQEPLAVPFDDPLSSRETFEAIRVYYALPLPLREKVFGLLRAAARQLRPRGTTPPPIRW
jgi:hypothetical protein